MKTFENYSFKDKKALIRVDFNVPLNDKYEITDATRINAAIPTIIKILDDGGSVILMSHLGRPKQGPEEKFSLKHLINYLSEKLNTNVKFADDCIGDSAKNLSASLKPGEVLLLENLRFYKEETKGDEDFAKKLASLGDVYVNDAFGIEIINQLMNKVDNFIIGGGMMFTFIKAMGGNIGNSLIEEDLLKVAIDTIEKVKKTGVNFYLPVDVTIASEFSNEANKKLSNSYDIPDGWMGLDIGPKTCKKFADVIEKSKTILWNGPMGVFEMPNFETGTKYIAEAVAEATQNGAFSLIGGGDSVAAINKYNLKNKVSYVSTGGGAMLEYIEGKELPGVFAIKN
jgi:phosphoglycerate kinase